MHAVAAAITFDSPAAGGLAALLLAAAVAFATRRTPAVPRAALALAGAGVLLLALAAGGLSAVRPAGRPVAVWVDLSPSTRGAAYRDPEALRRRVRELLGDRPYELRAFADGAGELDQPGRVLAELPSTRTTLPADDAPAVLLFGDGRFTAPDTASPRPPIFPVPDPALDDAPDAAVTALDARGDAVSVSVRTTSAVPRALALQGVEGGQTVSIDPGVFTLTRRALPGAGSISAAFAPGDAWPENDALRAGVPPPPAAGRWWVGSGGAPDATWRRLTPPSLPIDPAAYLGAAVVVLDDVAADDLGDARQRALDRYVREFGGGLVLLGGGRAFAAGGYAGTVLDALSPLASTPPEPSAHWVLLADASGSMNQLTGPGGRTRWRYAADAVAAAVPRLPPADRLSVGSFARDVRWWVRGTTVAARDVPLPPAGVSPRGETNLEAAVRDAAAAVNVGTSQVTTHLLVMTDARANIRQPSELAGQLKSRGIRLHVLLIGETDGAVGLAALRSVVADTGGTLRAERLPQEWAAGLRELLRGARPDHLGLEPLPIRFLDPLALPELSTAMPWNRTWPKSDATPLAEGSVGGERRGMAARWNAGEGRVAAVAFAPPAELAEAVARLVERPPRDPRFRVSWEAGSTLRVAVDATDGASYLNGEALTLELDGPGGSRATHPVRQTAPGRYEVATAAPPLGAIARLRQNARGGSSNPRLPLDTIAIAGRYAPEFDAVGTDRPALAELARRTGGAVVESGVTRPLDLPDDRRAVPLVSWLAAAGAVLIAAGLVRWRIGS